MEKSRKNVDEVLGEPVICLKQKSLFTKLLQSPTFLLFLFLSLSLHLTSSLPPFSFPFPPSLGLGGLTVFDTLLLQVSISFRSRP